MFSSVKGQESEGDDIVDKGGECTGGDSCAGDRSSSSSAVDGIGSLNPGERVASDGDRCTTGGRLMRNGSGRGSEAFARLG